MAYLTLYSPSENSVEFAVADLSEPFNTTYYKALKITNSPSSSGGTQYYYISAPSPTSWSYNGWSDTIYGLNPSTTYTMYAWVQAQNGTWYLAGSDTTTTQGRPRPSNFYWSYPKRSGQPFNLYAFEWNMFLDSINDFRYYKYLSPYSFNYATSGSPFTAYQYRQAIEAIKPMNLNVPLYRWAGDIIYASDLNALVDALNSIY